LKAYADNLQIQKTSWLCFIPGKLEIVQSKNHIMEISELQCRLSKPKHLCCQERLICISRKSKFFNSRDVTDQENRPEDSEIEVANMKEGVGKMEAFPSIWGHWAGGPGDSKEDVKVTNLFLCSPS